MVATTTPDTGTPLLKAVPVSSNKTLPSQGLANTGVPGVVLIWAAVLAVLAIGVGVPMAILGRRSLDEALADEHEFMDHQNYAPHPEFEALRIDPDAPNTSRQIPPS